MTVYFKPEALAEFIDAMNFLDRDRPGMGTELHKEVNRAVNKIAEAPHRWPTILGNVRRYLVHRFKYQIIYQVLHQEIQIVAVMHTRRRPGYWIERVDPDNHG